MIKIKKSKTADTRSCDFKNVTIDQLRRSSVQHICDVIKGFEFVIDKLNSQSVLHDYTKNSHMDMFHKDFVNGFETQDWYELHKKVERHHFNDPKYIKDDVNLLDVIEQIIDCSMAGMGRSGEFRKEPLPEGLLQKAYDNTVDLMLKNIEVEEN